MKLLMKVLMLVPDNQMIDRRVLQQAKTLVEAGYSVTLLAGFECQVEEHYTWRNVDIHRYKFDWNDERLNKIRKNLYGNVRLYNIVKKIFMKFVKPVLKLSPYDNFILSRARQFKSDIVHVHDLPLLHHGSVLAKEWKTPLVFDSHEIYYMQGNLPEKFRKQFEMEEKQYLPTTNLFITVNDAIADFYIRKYDQHPLVLLNAADTPPVGFNNDSRKALSELAGVSGDSFLILYQGWFSPERNLPTLIRTAEYLPTNAYVLMLGYGKYEEELRRILSNQPWAEKVKFLGTIEQEKMLFFTAGANLGIIPYLPVDLNHELCSPNKFFEFVQAGVPVLAHDLVFFRNMAERFGVVSVSDLSSAESMAAAMNNLITDQTHLLKMRTACQMAAKELNWEVEGKKLITAYSKLINLDH
jgi:glycosyltransferase involved in cell wall biosynthesis